MTRTKHKNGKGGLLFFVRYEIHRDRVDTVSCVFFGEVLAHENVSKVSAAADHGGWRPA